MCHSAVAAVLPQTTASAPPWGGNSNTLDFNDLKQLGPSSASDLLGTGLGLRWSSFSGDALGGPDLRGFGENSSSRTLVLLDGRPLNRPDLGEADWSQIPVGQLESATVLRGAQTVRHGGSAAAGVISLKTIAPTATPSGGVSLGAGSFGETQADAWASAPLHDWRFLGAASLDSTEGWRRHSAENVRRAWVKTVSPERDGIVWQAEAGVTSQTTELPGGLASGGYPATPRASFAVDAEARQTTLHAGLSPVSSASAPLTWEAPFRAESRRLESDFDGIYADSRLDSLLWQPVLSWDAAPWRWESGASLGFDTLNYTGWRSRARTQASSHAHLERLNAGAFLRAERDIGQGWKASAGTRWEGQSVDARNRPVTGPGAFDGHTTGSGPSLAAGLDWAGPAGRAWLDGATIRRFPVLDEIASYQGFALSRPFNAALRPETGLSLETGAAWQPAPGWETKAGAFALWLDNEIAYDFVPNLNTNLARTERFGSELSVSRSWETLRLGASAGLVQARQVSGPYAGRDVCLVPGWTSGVFAAFTPTESLSLRWDTRWSGAAWEGNDPANTQPRLPGHTVSDARLTWKPAHAWSCNFLVRNVFDEEYASKKYAGLWYPANPRSLFASLAWSF